MGEARIVSSAVTTVYCTFRKVSENENACRYFMPVPVLRLEGGGWGTRPSAVNVGGDGR